jgi:signal transduction histidine kinase
MALHHLERAGPAEMEGVRAELRDARDGAERVARIVRDLRLFSRPIDGALAAVDVNAVLDTCLRLVQNQLRHRARVVTDYGALPPVLANEGHLAQLLLERLVAAAQALPESSGQEREVRLSTSRRPDGQVLVEVAGASLVLPPAPPQ